MTKEDEIRISNLSNCDKKRTENKDLFFCRESDNGEYLKLLNLAMKNAQNTTDKSNS